MSATHYCLGVEMEPRRNGGRIPPDYIPGTFVHLNTYDEERHCWVERRTGITEYDVARMVEGREALRTFLDDLDRQELAKAAALARRLSIALQVAIAAFGLPGLALVFYGNEAAVMGWPWAAPAQTWGRWLGLASQPFWAWALVRRGKSWGMLAVCAGYTVVWGLAAWRPWG